MKTVKTISAMLLVGTILLSTSCKKEDNIKPSPAVNHSCPPSDEIGLVQTELYVYLMDFTVTNFGSNCDSPNDNHFNSTLYALTKSNGVTIDSIPLNLFGNFQDTLDLSSSADQFIVTSLPTQVDAGTLKINKLHKTTLEIYDGSTKLGSIAIGMQGFYGDVTDFQSYSFSTLYHSGNNRIMTRL
jgi:hypothetical protein